MLRDLSNRYLLLRHGPSLANQAGIIISDTDEGIHGWGLVDGACLEIEKELGKAPMPQDLIMYSSPFKRAVETARCAAEAAGCADIFIAYELRERYFGSFNKTDDSNYPIVWKQDEKNDGNRENGVESPLEVLSRIEGFILGIDKQHSGKTIILVSHGDPLNILLCGVSGRNPGIHRNVVKPMETGELRPLFA